MEPEEVLQFICRRRSVRRFRKKAVPEETLTLLLRAAMAAPSGNNAQPWEWVVVRDPKIKEELSRIHTWVYMVADAPAAVVVMGDRGSEWWKDDCAAATENLLLAAANLGLGTVWCGIQERDAQAVRGALGAPDRLGVLCVVAVGYPAETPPAHTKYRKDKIHWDRFDA